MNDLLLSDDWKGNDLLSDSLLLHERSAYPGKIELFEANKTRLGKKIRSRFTR